MVNVVAASRHGCLALALFVLPIMAGARAEDAPQPAQQQPAATPSGQKPRHLLRDHDVVYGRDFRRRARRIGIDAIATPIPSPRAKTER